MDTKKVLEKLLKIAENQQKIIMKLAQTQQGLPPDSLPNSQVTFTDSGNKNKPASPPPTPLPINQPKHVAPGDAIKAKLDPQSAGLVALVRVRGGNPFNVEYVSKGKVINQAKLEDAIALATQNAQKEGAGGVPTGQFQIVKVTG